MDRKDNKYYHFVFTVYISFILTIINIGLSNALPGQYFIQFIDKSQTEYSLEDPLKFLSEKAVKRKSFHNITIDSLDLPVSSLYKDSIRKTIPVVILFETKWLNGIIIDIKDSGKVELLDQLSFVKKVELVRPDSSLIGPNKRSAIKSENDFYSLTYSHIKSEYGSSFRQTAIHNGHNLHEKGYLGNDMLIAVIDAGFENVDKFILFENSRKNKRIIGAVDIYGSNESVYNMHEHGMHVLSVMASKIPGLISGSAPEASYFLLRSEDINSEYRIEEYAWVTAAELADSAGADIINSSLGYSLFDDKDMNYTYNEMDGQTAIVTIGAEIAASKGILVVSSAGNQGEHPWQYITAPADGKNVLTVGAVNRNGVRAAFSSSGPTSDGRIKPNIMAVGEGTTVASRTDGNIFDAGRGTSFSAPVISGLSACLWQAFPELSNFELIKAIENSAQLYNNPDNEYGFGIPNFYLAYNQLKGIDYRLHSQNLQILKVFPNPFYDNFKIYFFAREDLDFLINIKDMTGRVIESEYFQVNGNSFNFVETTKFNELPAGIYITEIGDKENYIIQKIVKY